jgi:hypothetical protein
MHSGAYARAKGSIDKTGLRSGQTLDETPLRRILQFPVHAEKQLLFDFQLATCKLILYTYTM